MAQRKSGFNQKDEREVIKLSENAKRCIETGIEHLDDTLDMLMEAHDYTSHLITLLDEKYDAGFSTRRSRESLGNDGEVDRLMRVSLEISREVKGLYDKLRTVGHLIK